MTTHHHSTYGDVTLLTQYDQFAMVQTTAGVKAAYPGELTLINANVVALSSEEATPTPTLMATIEEEKSEPEAIVLVNINASSWTTIAKALPKLGKMPVKRFKEAQNQLQNKRYRDFAHFKDVNKNLFDNQEAWDALEAQVTFED